MSPERHLLTSSLCFLRAMENNSCDGCGRVNVPILSFSQFQLGGWFTLRPVRRLCQSCGDKFIPFEYVPLDGLRRLIHERTEISVPTFDKWERIYSFTAPMPYESPSRFVWEDDLARLIGSILCTQFAEWLRTGSSSNQIENVYQLFIPAVYISLDMDMDRYLGSYSGWIEKLSMYLAIDVNIKSAQMMTLCIWEQPDLAMKR